MGLESSNLIALMPITLTSLPLAGIPSNKVTQPANLAFLNKPNPTAGSSSAQPANTDKPTAKGQPVVSKDALNKAARTPLTAEKIARLPWEAKPVNRAPKESIDQQRARFFSNVALKEITGSVAAEPTLKPLKVFSFKDSQGKLKLPNLNDSKKNSDVLRDPNNTDRYVLKPQAVLQKNKDDVWKATYVYGAVGLPLASDLMRHYLGASGDTYEMLYDMSQLTTKPRLDNYRSELEKSAIKYAQDNPRVSEFTIQGPLMSEHKYENDDVYYGLANYYLGGRAHYKVARDSSGKLTLDGQTQMFIYDYYNFKPTGQSFPIPNNDVPQGNLLQMSITNDPKTGKPMARAFEVFLYEPPQNSYITPSH